MICVCSRGIECPAHPSQLIVAAAIKTSDGKVWSVPRPGRHDSVFKKIFEEGDYDYPLNEIQGFVDEDGNFLTRDEAEPVARKAKQLVRPLIGGILTSEDLWRTWRCGYEYGKKDLAGGCGNIYEIPKKPKPRRGQRINRARTTTCPTCGNEDALYGRSNTVT